MNLRRRLLTTLAVGVIAATPLALAGGAIAHPGNGQAKGHAKSHASNGKAFGKLCQGESKKHVKGQKGTPFSVCVSGANKLLKSEKKG